MCLLHNDERSDQFLIFSLVEAASTAPDTTPKVTQFETRCPLFSVRKERKKPRAALWTYVCWGFPGKNKNNKTSKERKIDQLPVTQAAIVRHCSSSISSREPGRSCPLSYSNPVYASHLFLHVHVSTVYDVLAQAPLNTNYMCIVVLLLSVAVWHWCIKPLDLKFTPYLYVLADLL